MTVARKLLGTLVGALGLALAQRLLNPAPIPALTVLAGGLIGTWIWSTRGAVAWGALAGLLVGAVLHARSHLVEGRAEDGALTAGHVLADSGVGLVVGGVLLLLALAVAPPETSAPPAAD